MAGDEVRELLERVTAATGANYALECDIRAALEPEMRAGQPPPAYLCSIDAALALVERVLPKAVWTLEQDLCILRVLTADDVAEFNFGYAGRGGKCTALAIVGALLTALQQDAETTQAGEGR